MIWRRIREEDATSIGTELQQIFRERGPPRQILFDNAASFRSQHIRQLLDKWSVEPIYWCAYRPAGNGIVERCHRTIKRMAARSNADVLDMVFWFNSSPKDGLNSSSVPSNQVFQYSWRLPGLQLDDPVVEREGGDFVVGDAVFVKPPDARCTTTWPIGIVTDESSGVSVEVNGIQRHLADLRKVPPEEFEDDDDDEFSVEMDPPVRPHRITRRPDFYGNNIHDS